MGKILFDDFISQKKNLVAILFVAIPAAAVGFAFQVIYYCVGIILTAGFCIIYINCFFDYLIAMNRAEKLSQEDNDPLVSRLRKKLQVRTKYVEIVIVSTFIYIFMSIAYILDAFDRGRFNDPFFSIVDHIEEIMLFPIIFMFLASVFTPIMFSKKINKALFISLAAISIIIPYGVFISDYFLKFTEIELLMSIIPLTVIGFMFISLFISLSIVIRQK